MQKLRIFLFALAALPWLVAGCSKDPEIVDPSQETDTYEATIKLNATIVNLSSTEGAKGMLVFSVDHEWTLEIPEEATWLSANKTSGSASKSATISFTAQANEGARRSVTCRIRSGAKSKKFTVAQENAVLVLSQSDVKDWDKYYKPGEFNYDMLRSDATWSWCRSKQSEHFVVFWGRGYGDYGLYGERMGQENTSPSTLSSGSNLYVDIDDLLEKAEEFYRVNINVLKFADISSGKSNLNKYKMQIYLLHQTEWVATGGGYDNVIGALWINPGTCHPVGSTIAHEIGHSFQYMVYCDQIANGAPNDFTTGWRYGFGGNGGCGFWEQSAQWQAYQSYAEQAFSTVNFTEFTNNCHRHFLHEHQRYASYFLMWYWADKYGVEEIGRLWRESKSPEDPCQTYMRVHGLTVDQFNEEIYEYAAKCCTWDFDVESTNLDEGKLTGTTQSVREFGKNYIGHIKWEKKASDDWYAVSSSRVPEATGFNHIALNPAAGSTVSVDFEGMAGDPLYNPVSDATIAGWTCGFVALGSDGTRTYSPAEKVKGSATLTFDVPSGTKNLWFVVAATPDKYLSHAWDEDNTNDEVWPYRIKVSGTTIK